MRVASMRLAAMASILPLASLRPVACFAPSFSGVVQAQAVRQRRVAARSIGRALSASAGEKELSERQEPKLLGKKLEGSTRWLTLVKVDRAPHRTPDAVSMGSG